MGTNYYIHDKPCKHCGRSDGSIHIGKSSAGWKFVFNFNRGRYYKTPEQLKQWLIGKKIKNEYGKSVPRASFWKMVEHKQEEDTHRGTGSQVITLDGYEFIDSDFS